MTKFLLFILCCISNISLFAFTITYRYYGGSSCEMEFTILPTFEHTVELTSIYIPSYNLDKKLEIPETIEYNSITYTITSLAEDLNISSSSISLPKTISTIGNDAFSSNVTELIIDTENPHFCCIDGIIYNKSKTELITSIKNITSAVLPETVQTIHANAFHNCKLATIDLSQSIISIGYGVFSGCKNLSGIFLPESLLEIGDSCFAGSGIESIIIPQQITKINSYLFDNTPLKEISLPENIIEIGEYAFFYSELTSIKLPKNLSHIRKSAFSNTPIKEIELPSYLNKLDDNAFCNCLYLEKIFFLGDYCNFGQKIFSNCNKLVKVNLPHRQQKLGDYMFEDCKSLTDIMLPPLCRKTGSYSFKNCSALTNVYFPSSLKQISSFSFYNCDNLSKIVIPEGVERILDGAFVGCRIKELHIPKSLNTRNSIASGAFNCKVKDIYCVWSDPPTFNTNIWSDWDYEYSNLFIPLGSKQNYLNTSPWENFLNIIEYEDSGIDNIQEDVSDVPIEIYNLNGIRINQDNISPGIYIKRQGTKTEKFIVN